VSEGCSQSLRQEKSWSFFFLFHACHDYGIAGEYSEFALCGTAAKGGVYLVVYCRWS
jgi:hypothetical protein